MTNTVHAHQSLPDNDSYRTFYLSPSSGRIATATSPYWISVNDVVPPISKSGSYSRTNQEIDYTVLVNDDKTLVAENKTYRIRDGLSLSGILYKEDSVVLRDENNKVVYSGNPKITADAKYKNLVKFSCTKQSSSNNSFVLEINNSSGRYLPMRTENSRN